MTKLFDVRSHVLAERFADVFANVKNEATCKTLSPRSENELGALDGLSFAVYAGGMNLREGICTAHIFAHGSAMRPPTTCN